MLVAAVLLAARLAGAEEEEWAGYLAYCPCMGRFGNQADQLLGAMALAKALRRTLVAPPWVEYRPGAATPRLVPWDHYFQLERLQEFGPAVTMETFMAEGGPASQLWPPGERAAFCYTARRGDQELSCNAKEGSPFGPFWDHFNISFPRSELYSPLHYDTHHGDTAAAWSRAYPASRYPVLAFTGAPAAFPVQQQNLALQRHVVWTDAWRERARAWIQDHLPAGPYVGIHLRNGADWARACQHTASGLPHLFSSPQCLGYRNEHGQLSSDLCLPALTTVAGQVRRAVREARAVAVYVASDSDHLLEELRRQFRNSRVTFHRQEGDPDPHLDLVILGQSNLFIGNCVSSFSAFVARGRKVLGLPTQFWAFPVQPAQAHTEL
jgi:peptide-O-fucosyltransferase